MAVADTVYVDVMPQFDRFAAAFDAQMDNVAKALQRNMEASFNAMEDGFESAGDAATTTMQSSFDEIANSADQAGDTVAEAIGDGAADAASSLDAIGDAASDAASATESAATSGADGMAGAFESATSAVESAFSTLRDNASDVASSIRNAFENSLDAIKTAASAVGETVMTAANVGIGAMAGLAASTITAGVGFNSLSQDIHMSLTTILGTEEAASDLMGEIIELNRTAAFSRQSFLSATQVLSAYGVEADDVGDHLWALQDAAVATGGGEDAFNRLVDILAQVNVNSRIGGDEIRRMADMGIDAVTLMAEHFGTTGDEMRAMMDQGIVGADELSEALGTRYAGAVDNFGDSIAGAQGMVSAGFRNIGSDLVESFIGLEGGGAAVDGLNLIADGLFHIQSEVLPAILPYVEDLADAFVIAAGWIGDTLKSIDEGSLDSLFDMFEGLGPLVAAVGAGILTSFAGGLPIIGRFLGGFNPIVIAIGVLIAMSPELREAFVDTFQRIWEALEPIIPIVLDLVGVLLNALVPVVTLLVDIFADLIVILLPIVEALLEIAVTVLEILLPVLTFLIDFLLGDFESAFETMAGWMQTIIDTVTTAWQQFRDILSGIWNSVTNRVELAVAGIRAAWDGIMGFIFGLPDKIRNAVSGMWNPITEGFRNAINALIDGWNSINLEIGPFTIPDWVPAVGGNTFHIPNMWPNLPKLQRGGVTRDGGAAELHPTEAVLPLEDQRSTNLLAGSLQQAMEQIGMSAGAGNGDVEVKVFIDGQEFRGMIKTEISETNRQVRRDVMSGRGRSQ